MSSVPQSHETAASVIRLQADAPVRSLWMDALLRLMKNKAAVAGAIIIAASILMAIFAPLIAPKAYADAVLADSNAAPRWLTSVFPGMKPIEDGGYIKLSNDYPIGADRLGRDLLSRIIYGS
ncbi:MAG TPA: hypothetical protein VJZ27_18555, partial [Aggregatilineales bacterium]|nr:hypothetical protein [Aggregatilineales bacterium]